MRYLHIYYKTSLFIIFFFSFQSTTYSQENFIKVRPEVKINYIENDPAEKQLATDNGWFDKMTVVKNRLTAKKQLLTDSLI